MNIIEELLLLLNENLRLYRDQLFEIKGCFQGLYPGEKVPQWIERDIKRNEVQTNIFKGRALTPEEVNQLRARYKKFCQENDTNGMGEFKLKE